MSNADTKGTGLFYTGCSLRLLVHEVQFSSEIIKCYVHNNFYVQLTACQLEQMPKINIVPIEFYFKYTGSKLAFCHYPHMVQC